MYSEPFDYHEQARNPRMYLLTGLAGAVLYAGLAQGWGLAAILLAGPVLAWILVQLVMNPGAGFRLWEQGISFYDADRERMIDWHDLSAVTLSADGAGGAICILHLADGREERLPATAAFTTDRLAQEFRLRGVPVWRATPEPRGTLATA